MTPPPRQKTLLSKSPVLLGLTDCWICSPKQCTQNQVLDIFSVFIFLKVLFGLCLKLPFELEEYLKNDFCSFPYPSWCQPTRFRKLIFKIFYGVLSQIVQPKSNLELFRSFSLFDSAPWFFLKTCLRVRKSDFEIIFAPSLRYVCVSRKSLVNWPWKYFLWLIMLFGFCLKLTFELNTLS